jgi:hypothetical protein
MFGTWYSATSGTEPQSISLLYKTNAFVVLDTHRTRPTKKLRFGGFPPGVLEFFLFENSGRRWLLPGKLAPTLQSSCSGAPLHLA